MINDVDAGLAYLPEHLENFIRLQSEVHAPAHTGVKINWGRGRLCPYQSQLSLASYFCALNDVNLKQYGIFWGECLLGTASCSVFRSRAELVRVAEILDEPPEIARTLDPSYLEIPACYGTFTLSPSYYESSKTRMSFCPVCIQHGYHASFHEALWLKSCPIHNVAIERCFIENSQFDSHVRELTKLFRSRNSKWPELFPLDTIWKDHSALSTFRNFLKWIRAAKRTTSRVRASSISYSVGNPYEFQDSGILLGRLAVANPIPEDVQSIFRIPICTGRQSLYPVDRDSIIRIDSISNRVPFEWLLWFHRKAACIRQRETEHRRLAIQLIEKLKNEHLTCHCLWEWDRYSYWQRSTPEHIQESGRYCPYTYQLAQLKDRWLEFSNDDFGTRDYRTVFQRYTQILRELFEFGTAVGGEEVRERRPQDLVRDWADTLRWFKFIPSIESLLDTVLTLQVEACAEVVANWFDAIRADKCPQEIQAAESINLMSDNHKAWISAWNPVISSNGLGRQQ